MPKHPEQASRTLSQDGGGGGGGVVVVLTGRESRSPGLMIPNTERKAEKSFS